MLDVVLAFLLVLLLCVGFGIYLLYFLTSYEIPSPRIIYNTITRDLRYLFKVLKVKRFLKKCYRNNVTIVELLRETCKEYPNKVCFICSGKEWTFQEVEDYSNRLANYFANAGYKKGDEVVLFMENCAEYILIWLGLAKIGVITALINSNLRQEALKSNIRVAKAKAIIFNDGLSSAVKDVIPLLNMNNKSSIEFYCLGAVNKDLSSARIKHLETCLEHASKKPIPESVHNPNFSDKLVYIYTSGTTGLPKASVIRHSKLLTLYGLRKNVVSVTKNDISYNFLPLYHTLAGLVEVALAFCDGTTVVIKKKFSASEFWADIHRYKVNVFIHVGEICRYLLSLPPCPEETNHNIRLVWGVGLHPHIWDQFQKRFKIPNLVEVYGATEGNVIFINTFGKNKSLGFIPKLMSRFNNAGLIKINTETGEPLRNKAGLCMRCGPGEPGQLVGKIVQNNPLSQFDGYTDSSATEKKIIRNCFSKDDMFFLSGDLLTMDEEGHIYFMDRMGDTYRWKGENVSTREAETIIGNTLGIVTCVVYGVHIPGTEGKAGMLAIAADNIIDISELYKNIQPHLPSYAVPLFVRFCKSLDITGTYRMKKFKLQQEGYNIKVIADPIFYLDKYKKCYVKLDEKAYMNIVEKKNNFV